MQDPTRPDEQEEPCNPQWIHMNHLFSYCAKSLACHSAPTSAGKGEDSDTPHCRRGSCVFSFRKH